MQTIGVVLSAGNILREIVPSNSETLKKVVLNQFSGRITERVISNKVVLELAGQSSNGEHIKFGYLIQSDALAKLLLNTDCTYGHLKDTLKFKSNGDLGLEKESDIPVISTGTHLQLIPGHQYSYRTKSGEEINLIYACDVFKLGYFKRLRQEFTSSKLYKFYNTEEILGNTYNVFFTLNKSFERRFGTAGPIHNIFERLHSELAAIVYDIYNGSSNAAISKLNGLPNYVTSGVHIIKANSVVLADRGERFNNTDSKERLSTWYLTYIYKHANALVTFNTRQRSPSDKTRADRVYVSEQSLMGVGSMVNEIDERKKFIESLLNQMI